LKPYGIGLDEVLKRAAKDPLSQLRLAYREDPQPHFRTYGPKTRREFFRLLELTGGKIS